MRSGTETTEMDCITSVYPRTGFVRESPVAEPMRIALQVYTPGQVHFLKNFISRMQARGHDLILTALKKDISLQLLDRLQIEYTNLGSYGDTPLQKLLHVPLVDLRLYREMRRFDPDIFYGFAMIEGAHVSRVLRKPCVQFTDTELAREQQMLFVPFSDAVITPSCFQNDYGIKHIRVESYKELAYLHPRYFHPDPAVLEMEGLEKGEPFCVVRFVSWTATHDIGQRGIQNKTKMLEKLEEASVRVIVTSEIPLPGSLERFRSTTPPEKLHDLLHYATLYIGEGATTATEAAVLGTPAIYVSSVAKNLGNHQELEERYGLVHRHTYDESAIDTALMLLDRENLKRECEEKRKRLLSEKIDITAFMVWFIENYPESFHAMRENPDLQFTATCGQ